LVARSSADSSSSKSRGIDSREDRLTLSLANARLVPKGSRSPLLPVLQGQMDNQPVQVVPGLFIGSFMAERNKAALQAAGITHILQAAEGLEPSYPQDFIYMHVAVQASAELGLARTAHPGRDSSLPPPSPEA
ncbi:uncharacterized protein HaLaN_29074, partial [Haematococcus lacustris]